MLKLSYFNRYSINFKNIYFYNKILFSTSSNNNICNQLGVIGGGKMAEALINALNIKGVQLPDRIKVFDVNVDRLNHLKSKYNVETSSSIQDLLDESDVVILAVKPQHVQIVSKSVTKPPKGLLLSIVAGYTINQLELAFNTKNIVRSMPNTPAMVLEGMTVWLATKSTPPDMVSKAKQLLGSIGEEIEVSDEGYLDMATAVSGSGPAYVFLTMEAMTDAAVHLGFPREIAEKLVLTTIRGSATYALQSPQSISDLRYNVTSPGGTTASALYQLERGGFRTNVADAIWAAYRRALELGNQNPNVGPGRNKFNDNS